MEPTEQQKAADKDCDLAKREHKWVWVWNDKNWSNDRVCTRCGKVQFNVSRKDDEQT